MSRLYAQYRQAEVHRKALVFQKRYLQCQVDAFYQTQQAALYMMADMGAPVNLGSSHSPTSKYPRAYARFKAVGYVVIATLRFRYILQRKMHYLRSKITKLTQSQGAGLSNTRTKPASSADIPPTTGIQATLSDPPAYTSLHGPSQPLPTLSSHLHTQSHQHTQSHHQHTTRPYHHTHSSTSYAKRETATSSSVPTKTQPITTTAPPITEKRTTKHSTTRSQQDGPLHIQGQGPSHRTRSKTSTGGSGNRHGHKELKSGVQGGGSKVKPLDSKATSTAGSSDDPQLMAYIKGLEKLQARLNKTKL